ncbi:MAG TPA: HNH endonuclease signature motif containing protein, partial [Acidimicrobiales bacterium]
GREPKPHELRRTSAQRRADALVEMAIRSQMAPADGRRPEPLFSVLVGLPKLLERMCQLENGSPIAPGALFPWMDSAYFERAIFTPGTRLEISIQSRLFTGATRRAIELRDRQCTHEFCEEPAINCQVDHIQMYSQGGLTTQENGRLLCGFHNRLRNQDLVTGRAPPDG